MFVSVASLRENKTVTAAVTVLFFRNDATETNMMHRNKRNRHMRPKAIRRWLSRACLGVFMLFLGILWSQVNCLTFCFEVRQTKRENLSATTSRHTRTPEVERFGLCLKYIRPFCGTDAQTHKPTTWRTAKQYPPADCNRGRAMRASAAAVGLIGDSCSHIVVPWVTDTSVEWRDAASEEKAAETDRGVDHHTTTLRPGPLPRLRVFLFAWP